MSFLIGLCDRKNDHTIFQFSNATFNKLLLVALAKILPLKIFMDFEKISRLIASSTYRELALRAKEYLYYRDGGVEQELAEITMYNCTLSFLTDLGMERHSAAAYCDNEDNLTELAQYISSILG